MESGSRVIQSRGMAMDIIGTLGGKTIHPVCAIPGGMSKAINEEERARFEETANELVKAGTAHPRCRGNVLNVLRQNL